MSVETEGFLGYGVVVPMSECLAVCNDFIDVRDAYQNEMVCLNMYSDESPMFFGVRLNADDLDRVVVNANLLQEWKHKAFVAYHRIFEYDVKMPKPRFVFTTCYW